MTPIKPVREAPHGIQIGVLVSTSLENPQRYPVYFWRDYGVVCPNLLTTNGSVGYFSRWVFESRNHYEFVETIIPFDTSNVFALRDDLLNAYRYWMTHAKVEKEKEETG